MKVQTAKDEVPHYLKIAKSVFERLLIDGKPDWDSLILNTNYRN